MASFDNITITYQGRALLARAMAFPQSVSVNFTCMKVGDGQAPYDPETLTDLVSPVSRIPISRVTPYEDGSTTIRSVFKPYELQEDLYLREVGLYAEDEEGEEILFGYANAGDKADIIPASNSQTLMEEVFLLTIVTGQAKVLYSNYDPTAMATIEDVELAIEKLNVEQLKKEIEECTQLIDDIKDEINEASQGYVSKTGDTVQGDLIVTGNITGDLTGSSQQWSRWTLFSQIEDLNKYMGTDLDLDECSMEELVNAMPDLSRLVVYIEEGNRNTHLFKERNSSDVAISEGLLDIQRYSQHMSEVMFTTKNGRAVRSAVVRGQIQDWYGSNEVPPGTILAYHGSNNNNAPLGYLLAIGQLKLKSNYPRLAAILGTQYCVSGDNTTTHFRLPDLRGRFLRCHDPANKLDPLVRTIGSFQQDAIQKITGTFDGNTDDGSAAKTGAFYFTGQTFYGSNGTGTTGGVIGFDSSRIVRSSTETRPTNFAVQFMYKY